MQVWVSVIGEIGSVQRDVVIIPCKKAAGFFIYGSTVVKFVAAKSDLLVE